MNEKCRLCGGELESLHEENDKGKLLEELFYCKPCKQAYYRLGLGGAVGHFHGLGFCGSRERFLNHPSRRKLSAP